jgi:general secretion pathway protein F
MPRFLYTAYDSAGDAQSGELEAIDAGAAERMLSQRGLVTLHIKVPDKAPSDDGGGGGLPWWQREIGPAKAPTLRETAQFIRELATLLDAGMTLDGALAVIAENDRVGRRAARVRRLREQVLAGKSLSEAMRLEAKPFADDVIGAVKAGESASELTATLNRLAAQLTRKLQVQSELRSALIYPCVLILMSVAVMIVVVAVLIPNIKPLFDDARMPMPTLILMLDAVQSAIVEGWPVALAAAAGVAFVLRTLRRSEAARLPFSRAVLRLPGLSYALRRRATAGFARTLGVQLISGVSTLPAMGAAAEQIRNPELRARSRAAIDRVRDGASPSEAFRGASALLPSASQFMAVGENSGRLGPVLLTLAETLERDEQEATKRFMSLLTPLITIALGLFVGLLMMSLMTAIGSLNDVAFR